MYAKIRDIVDQIPNLVTYTTFNPKINKVNKEIPGTANLATAASLNAKKNEIKTKIHNVTNLATAIALTAVENKIPNHNKYITAPEFNTLAAQNYTSRLAQANLASKNDIANFVKKRYFDDALKKWTKKIT